MGYSSKIVGILTLFILVMAAVPARAVTIASGTSIASATVYLSCWNYTKQKYPWHSTTAKSDGTFAFSDSYYYGPCGTYYKGIDYTCKVSAYPPYGTSDYVMAYSSEFAIDCSNTTAITLVHEKKNKTIKVSITDGVGAITSGVSVYVSRSDGNSYDYSSTTTATNGVYELKATKGKYYVSAYCTNYSNCDYSGYPNTYVALSESDSSASATLKFKLNKSSLAIAVSDGSKGIGGVYVSAYTYAGTSAYTTGTSDYVYISGKTNSGGAVTLKVPAGTYTVWVSAPYESNYSSLSKEVTVGDAELLAVPVVLSSKSAKFTVTVKDENGNAITRANVSGWTNDSGTYDYFWGKTSSTGTFTANAVDGRKYQVGAYYWPPYENGIPTTNICNYNLEGYQTAKASASGVSLTYTFPLCDHTVSLKTVDSSGVLVDTSSGWVEVKPAAQTSSDGYYAGTGATITNGKGSAKMRPNTKYTGKLSTWGTDYSAGDKVTFTTGASGGTSDVSLVLSKIDATISGSFIDSAGNAVSVKDTSYLYVYTTKDGNYRSCSTNQGTYTCDVSAGNWCLGYWVDYNSGYVSLSPGSSSQCYEVKSKDALKKNITLLKTGKILVTVKNPVGGIQANTWVEATASSVASYGTNKDNYYYGQGCVTGNDGTCTISVGASDSGTTYYVNAHTPYNIIKDNNWTQPDEQSVTLAAGGSAEVILSFGEPDGEITINLLETSATISAKHVGMVKSVLKASGDDASVLENATVDIFSNSGAYATGATDSGGTAKLKCTVADKWYAVAYHIFGNYLYMSEATEFDCPKAGSADATSKEVKIKQVASLPECQSKSFDASQATTLDCTDGFSVSFPENVLDSYGTNVSVTLAPVVTPFKSNMRPATFYGWRIKASKTDTNEEIITLNGYATITCPCDTSQLEKVGLTLAETQAKYYDSSQDAYKDVSCTQDTSSCKVTMTTNHLTDFVIAGNGNLKGLDGTPEGVIPSDPVSGGGDAASGGNSGSCGCRQGSGPVNLPTALLSLLPLVPIFFLRRKRSI